MRLNKKERLAIQQRKFCKQYITEDWDGCAANDYFANRYDAHIEAKYQFKPKTEVHISLNEIELAESNLNAALAPLAFTKDKLISFLMLLNAENVHIPHNITNTQEYVTNYLSIAGRILKKLLECSYPFQKIGI